MRVHVNVSIEGVSVNEWFDGATADEIVGKMKSRIARELSFPMKLAINAMGNVMFAQEVVRRYNNFKKLNVPIPSSCQEFLTLAQEQGIAQMA